MRRVAFYTVAVTIGFLLAVIAGEFAVRLASAKWRNVRYLATIDDNNKGLVHKNLAQFLDSKPQVSPFAVDMNYQNNSLGFKDTEFVKPKTPGGFRIMAVGDSFTYGVVPYPASVMTILENRLAKICSGRDVEVYNFGLPGSGVWDYYQVFDLAHEIYQPDLLLVHLYLGNDGPSAYFKVDDIPDGADSPRSRSYLMAFVKNSYRLMTGVTLSAINASRKTGAAKNRCGGCVVDREIIITDESPMLSSPVFSDKKWFGEIAANEISRFFVTPEDEEKRLWSPTLASLDKLIRTARSANIKVAVVLFPSAFQVYPEKRDEFFDRAKKYKRLSGLTQDKIDLGLPNRIFLNFCKENSLPCFDLTKEIVDAARASNKPLYRKNDTHWLIEGNRIAAGIEAESTSNLVCPQ